MTVHLYASTMWRAVSCPGSVKAERAAGNRDTPEAAWGREMHKLMEEVFADEITLSSIPEPERSYVHRCLGFLCSRGIDDVSLTEKRLFVLGSRGALLASCRADLISVSEGVVTIPDWKFYREPLEEYEWVYQADTMCAAALQEYPDCGRATAIAYLPVLDRSYEHGVDRIAMSLSVESIRAAHAVANVEEPPLHAGPWCARCSALAACPAALDSVGELAKQVNLEAIRGEEKLPTVSVMKERFLGEIDTWSRGRFQGAVELLPFLPALTAAIKERLRAEIKEGINHTSWELKPKRLPRSGAAADVRKVLSGHLGAETFNWDQFFEPRFGKIAEALKKRGKSDEEIREILRPFEQGKKCATCGRPAACYGAYEGSEVEEYACDVCCGHGNEDGHCRPVTPFEQGETEELRRRK